MDVLFLVITQANNHYDAELLPIEQLQACVTAAGMESEIYHVEYNDHPHFDRLLKQVRRKEPTLLYFEPVDFDLVFYRQAVDFLRQNYSGLTFAAGGFLPTSAPERCLKASRADLIFVAEADETLVSVARSLKEQRPISYCRGIVFDNNGQVIHNGAADPITDLDRLPWASRQILEKNRFGFAKISSNRGCQGNCIFCWNSTLNNGARRVIPVRRKSVDNVVSEIEHLIHQYGIHYFKFTDNCFTDPIKNGKEWISNFCDELKRRDLNIWYEVHMRAESIGYLGEDLLKKMKHEGLVSVFLGIESGADKTLKFLNKIANRADNINAIKQLRKLAIHFEVGFIMFNPFSSLDEYMMNIHFLKEAGIHYKFFHFLKRVILYCNSSIYEMVKKAGLLENYSLTNLYGYRFQNADLKWLMDRSLSLDRTDIEKAFSIQLMCDETEKKMIKFNEQLAGSQKAEELSQHLKQAQTVLGDYYYAYFYQIYCAAKAGKREDDLPGSKLFVNSLVDDVYQKVKTIYKQTVDLCSRFSENLDRKGAL